MADAGLVGHAVDTHACLVLDNGRATDRHIAHPVRFGHDPCSFNVAKGRANLQRHIKFLGELDAARVHDARPDACQLQHLVITDGVDFLCFGDNAGVGRINAIHIGIDFTADRVVHHARIQFHNRCQSDRRGVGAAAAQGGDIEVLIRALETGNDDNLAFIQRLPHALRGDVFDAGPRVRAVRNDADLSAGEADGWFAKFMDRHGQQGDGDLLAGGQKHVHFTSGWRFADFLGQRNKFIGRIAAGANHDDDLVAFLLSANGSPRRRHDPLRRRDAGAAEFLYDQGQIW